MGRSALRKRGVNIVVWGANADYMFEMKGPKDISDEEERGLVFAGYVLMDV